MAKTVKQIAAAAKQSAERKKKNAQDRIDDFKKEMGGKVDISKLGAQQKKDFQTAIADRKKQSNTVRTANIAISRATDAENIVKKYKDNPAEQMRQLRIKREEQMDLRGKALVDEGKKGKQFEAGGAFDYGLAAQAYGDAMRTLEGRQMGQGTSYTGPGAYIALDADGKPKLTTADRGGVPKGSNIYHIDPEEYIKRFRPKFQPTQEQLDKFGGPGAWAQGLLSGGADYTYLTPWQQTNFQWMLEDTPKGLLSAGDKQVRLPAQWRTDWRKEEWGDTYNEQTGRWEQATDPNVRKAAVENQLARYNAGLFNPYTGQGADSTGPQAWPDSPNPFRNDFNKTGPNVSSGAAGEYLLTDYTRPQLQDLSHLMPPEGLLNTPAQRAMVANQGAVWQPWAQTPEYTWSPGGTATYTPRKLPSLLDSNTGNNTTGNNTTGNDTTNKYIDLFGREWPSYHDWYIKSGDTYNKQQQALAIGNQRAALERIRIANKNKANQINTEANAV